MTREEARKTIDDYGTELMYFGMDLRDKAMSNPIDQIYDDFEEEIANAKEIILTMQKTIEEQHERFVNKYKEDLK